MHISLSIHIYIYIYIFVVANTTTANCCEAAPAGEALSGAEQAGRGTEAELPLFFQCIIGRKGRREGRRDRGRTERDWGSINAYILYIRHPKTVTHKPINPEP